MQRDHRNSTGRLSKSLATRLISSSGSPASQPSLAASRALAEIALSRSSALPMVMPQRSE
jgi:hypothetical protein